MLYDCAPPLSGGSKGGFSKGIYMYTYILISYTLVHSNEQSLKQERPVRISMYRTEPRATVQRGTCGRPRLCRISICIQICQIRFLELWNVWAGRRSAQTSIPSYDYCLTSRPPLQCQSRRYDLLGCAGKCSFELACLPRESHGLELGVEGVYIQSANSERVSLKHIV